MPASRSSRPSSGSATPNQFAPARLERPRAFHRPMAVGVALDRRHDGDVGTDGLFHYLKIVNQVGEIDLSPGGATGSGERGVSSFHCEVISILNHSRHMFSNRVNSLRNANWTTPVGPLPLLAENQFGGSPILFGRIIGLFTEDKADYVRILFDSAALSQIAQLGLVFAASLGGARQLRKGDDRDIQLFGQPFMSRDICETSCWRDSILRAPT